MSDEGPAEFEDRFVPSFGDAPLGAVIGGIAAALSAFGTLLIGGLMILIVADVIGRNFLDSPITGVAEIAGRTVVAIVFLQVPAAILQRRLTRADFLIRRIGGRAPALVRHLETAFCLTGAVVFALILWASWPKLIESWMTGDFFGVQGVFTIPTWPFRAVTVIGAALAVCAALYRASRETRAVGETA